MRLDKWLWCARFYKTRSLANTAIKTGKVKTGGRKIKAGKMISGGERIAIRRSPYTVEVIIQSLTQGRQSAQAARSLYKETEASRTARKRIAAQMQIDRQLKGHSKGRPGKRERREMIRFTRQGR